ncbi:MAG: hypothetical protein M5U32_18350 [Myxococcota bacterium]|nr:hypothetical protein [Myxococcota bacterium]
MTRCASAGVILVLAAAVFGCSEEAVKGTLRTASNKVQDTLDPERACVRKLKRDIEEGCSASGLRGIGWVGQVLTLPDVREIEEVARFSRVLQSAAMPGSCPIDVRLALTASQEANVEFLEALDGVRRLGILAGYSEDDLGALVVEAVENVKQLDHVMARYAPRSAGERD